MMFEVIMLVQKFLDKNDQNRLPSLHKEMLIRKEQEEIAKEKKEKQEQAKLEKEVSTSTTTIGVTGIVAGTASSYLLQ